MFVMYVKVRIVSFLAEAGTASAVVAVQEGKVLALVEAEVAVEFGSVVDKVSEEVLAVVRNS